MMLSRYSHYDDLIDVRGFVVNAFDALNFDIDLDLPDDLRRRYRNVIQNRYTYKDETTGQVKVGITYRCRLRGVSVLTKLRGRSNYKGVPRGLIVAQRKAHIDMIRQFDRQNGWVVATISDVDIYRRLLIDLRDPVTRDDMKNLLLCNEYCRVYEVYRNNITTGDWSPSGSPPHYEYEYDEDPEPGDDIHDIDSKEDPHEELIWDRYCQPIYNLLDS